MSTYSDIQTLVSCITSNCLLMPDNGFSPIFLIIDFFPLYLSIGLFSLSLYISDLSLFLFSCALTLHSLFNALLRNGIATPNRFPNCGAEFQMPSLSSSQSVFFVVIWIAFIINRKPSLPFSRIAMLNAFIILVLFSRVFIGINTSFELLIGATDGLFWGLITYGLFEFFIFPLLEYLFINYSWFRMLGFDLVLINNHFRNLSQKCNHLKVDFEIVNKQ